MSCISEIKIPESRFASEGVPADMDDVSNGLEPTPIPLVAEPDSEELTRLHSEGFTESFKFKSIVPYNPTNLLSWMNKQYSRDPLLPSGIAGSLYVDDDDDDTDAGPGCSCDAGDCRSNPECECVSEYGLCPGRDITRRSEVAC
jgi:hypothetical protein